MLRIQPNLPLIWRSPTSCQLGTIEPAVILSDLTPAHERLLDALRAGAPVVTLRALAAQGGMERREWESFLEVLAPSLERAAPPRLRIALMGDGPGQGEIRHILADDAYLLTTVSSDVSASELDASAADAAVVVTSFFVASADASVWLRRDVPHLLVSFDEQGATVGPLVVPGRTACAHCLDLHRRDADSSWVALASQLLYSAHPKTTATLRCAVAVEVAAMLASTKDQHDGRRVRLRVNNGGLTIDRVDDLSDVHPDCRCRSLQENVTSIESRRANQTQGPKTA